MLESTLDPDFNRDDFVLRDYLAADRTILATERTLLSYLRTAFTMFVAAVTFIKFFDTPVMQLLGWLFLPLGVILILFGVYRYKQVTGLVFRAEKNKVIPVLESEM